MIDNRFKYMNQPKYAIIRLINERNCKLKYAFTRTKIELVEVLHLLDNGANPYEVACCEHLTLSKVLNPIIRPVSE